MTSDWEGELLSFPGGMHDRLEHRLGAVPRYFQAYESFGPTNVQRRIPMNRFRIACSLLGIAAALTLAGCGDKKKPPPPSTSHAGRDHKEGDGHDRDDHKGHDHKEGEGHTSTAGK